MGFRELIKRVQHYSGFSDKESKDALEHMVESLAIRLTDGERKDFASQLPPELQAIALSVRTTTKPRQDLVEQFTSGQDISEAHAKKQIHAAWKALRDTVSPDEINDIRSQLPDKTVALLH